MKSAPGKTRNSSVAAIVRLAVLMSTFYDKVLTMSSRMTPTRSAVPLEHEVEHHLQRFTGGRAGKRFERRTRPVRVIAGDGARLVERLVLAHQRQHLDRIDPFERLHR